MRISDGSSDVCSSDLEITVPCVACDGVGRTRKNKTLQVKIPAVIDDGMRIRSSGNGEPGVNGGPRGDLYVEVHLKDHGIFEPDGEDLHCELNIHFTRAAQGGSLEVPALTGKGGISIHRVPQTAQTSLVLGEVIRGVRASDPGG